MVLPNDFDRITFSLPHSMNIALDTLKEETKRSKSEIIKLAIEQYIKQQEQSRLQKAVELMASEYDNDTELTALIALDGEEFL